MRFFLCLMIGELFLVGCSSTTYQREELVRHTEIKTLQYSEKDIEASFKKRANLPKTFKLGVYFKHSSKFNGADWRWTQQDQKSVLEFLRQNLSQERVSQIFVVDSQLIEGDELLSVRQAAARYRADAVMVIEGVGGVNTDFNSLAGTYFLIAPALFVPGNTLESLFAIHLSLWDVRNEVLYMSSSAEGELQKNYIPAWKERNAEYIHLAKQSALQNLKTQLQSELQQIR